MNTVGGLSFKHSGRDEGREVDDGSKSGIALDLRILEFCVLGCDLGTEEHDRV